MAVVGMLAGLYYLSMFTAPPRNRIFPTCSTPLTPLPPDLMVGGQVEWIPELASGAVRIFGSRARQFGIAPRATPAVSDLKFRNIILGGPSRIFAPRRDCAATQHVINEAWNLLVESSFNADPGNAVVPPR